MSERWGVYTRLSEDRDGTETATRRQEEDCRKRADQEGGTVVTVYRDSDLSAYKRKVKRPDFERLLTDVENGELDVLVVWRTDRFTRQPSDIERFVVAAERYDVRLVSVTEPYDSRTGMGLYLLRNFANNANFESMVKSERLRRKHVELAELGKVGGGGRRPFGYEPDRVTVREDEAQLVREAVDAVLDGASLHSVVRTWQEAGVKTVTGASWQHTTVRRLLASPRIAGLRVHRGRVTATAVWPAIVTAEQHERVKAALASRGTRGDWTTVRRYMLTGLVHCHCGARMTTRRGSNKRPRYFCSKYRYGGCDRCGVDAEGLEEYTTRVVLDRLDAQQVPADTGRPDRDRLVKAVLEDEARLERLAADHYVEGVVTRSQFVSASRLLERRLEAARRKLARLDAASVSTRWAGRPDALRDTWEAMGLDQRRAVVASVVERIRVGPRNPSRNRFDPDRVSIEWSV